MRQSGPSTPIARRLTAIITGAIVLAGLAPAAIAAGPGAATASAPTLENAVVAPVRHAAARAVTGAASAGAVPAASSATAPHAPAPATAISVPPIVQSYDGRYGAGYAATYEPPNPVIAASADWVVQVANTGAVLMSRATMIRRTLDLRALFGLPATEMPWDVRILWDEVHGRFIAASSSTIDGGTDAFLNVAVSATADPTGVWTSFSYHQTIGQASMTGPDNAQPQRVNIATSTDKLVVAADLEDLPHPGQPGSATWVIPWSAITAGSDPAATVHLWAETSFLTPANNLSASGTIHIVTVGAVGQLAYARITGTASAPAFSAVTDLTEAGYYWPVGADMFMVPRQPDHAFPTTWPMFIGIGDAVWRDGELWFDQTYANQWGTGSWNLSARAVHYQVGATAAAALPLYAGTNEFGSAGVDCYSPGLTISGNGTVFMTWNRSAAGEYISMQATAINAAGYSTPNGIAGSTGAYIGTYGYWSDAASLAPDPTNGGTVWQAIELSESDGPWWIFMSHLIADDTPPTVTTPTQTLITNTSLTGRGIPVRVSWVASDPESGIWQNGLARCADAACSSSTTVAETPAQAVTLTEQTQAVVPADTDYANRYAYRVFAANNRFAGGSWSPVGVFTPILTQQTAGVAYTGAWANRSLAWYSGGSAKVTSRVGATATFTFTGVSVGLLSARTTTGGKVKVYLDGRYKGLVNLRAAATQGRRLVYTATTTAGVTHRLRLVVVSGSVTVDGFIVLK